MIIFRYQSESGPRLGLTTPKGRFDLTAVDQQRYGSISTLLGGTVDISADNVGQPVPDDIVLLAPVDEQELWAAGVTYERSKVARMEESEGGGDFYDKVYLADRPELFFKSNPSRVVGPGQPIRVRKDSTWDVPEPEMTLVISAAGKIVGVTVGNDVSSRSIEGENPLYLPQAKCYDGAAALGPGILLLDSTVNLQAMTIHLEVKRGGIVAFSDSTSTARMKRTPEELVGYLFQECTFPDGVLLMTGTGIVPPDDFTLKSGDVVSITIDGVGTLTNPVA